MTTKHTQTKRVRLKRKIRMKISGTETRPRLSVFRSNRFIYAQLIDDSKNMTIASASDLALTKGTKNERARAVGKAIAESAKTHNITSVAFDRNGFKYMGRVKLLADEARAQGLHF